MRRLICMVVVAAAFGCSSSTESARTAEPTVAPDVFAGTWRSVTPSLEFIRLTVTSLSSQQGALGARLAFSGVMWEGVGRIDGDSLRIAMDGATTQPFTTSSFYSGERGIVVIRSSDAQTLRLQARPVSATPFDLTFVRE